MPFAVTWMHLEIVSQAKKNKKQHMISLIGGIYKKGRNELIYKTNRVTDVENKHGYQCFIRDKHGYPSLPRGGREKLGDWD